VRFGVRAVACAAVPAEVLAEVFVGGCVGVCAGASHPQALKLPTISTQVKLKRRMPGNQGSRIMIALLLEALLALAILVFIVWWTMFSGRKGGEVSPPHAALPKLPEPTDAKVLPPPKE
jgi:hypothetical protein